MNRKGFTLVELLVMLVVLGVLIGVTIPNITGIVANQKVTATRENAIRMVDMAKTKVATTKSIKKPQNGECMVFSLDYLDTKDEYNSGPNGGEYSKYDSFVIYKKTGNKYKYYVRLVEKLDDGDYGINLVEIDELTSNETNYVDSITDNTGFNDETQIGDIESNDLVQTICPTGTIKRYDTNEQETSLATPTNFANDSWYVISNVLKSGNTSVYPLGATKKVKIDDKEYDVRIANLSPCKSEYKSKSACGVVIEFVDVVFKRRMINGSGDNTGGWRDAALRQYLNGEFYSKLPKDLQEVIISTYIESGYGYDDNDRQLFITNDKIYLPSSREIWDGGYMYDNAENTRQLDYYKSLNASISNYSVNKKNYNGSPSWWWLRSANSNDHEYFNKVDYSGEIVTIVMEPGENGGVSPVFRIA